jgi:hypothetical protein
VERHDDDDAIHVYHEEIEGLLATRDVELMEEGSCPSKKCIRKSKRVAETQERHE